MLSEIETAVISVVIVTLLVIASMALIHVTSQIIKDRASRKEADRRLQLREADAYISSKRFATCREIRKERERLDILLAKLEE